MEALNKRKISDFSLHSDDNEKGQFLSLRRPSKRNPSTAMVNMNMKQESQSLWEVHCLLPNGIIFDSVVHPDDEIANLKVLILNRAITDELLPLRGCLNPDGASYTIKYVTNEGKTEECFDESKTLRELNPFQRTLKFERRSKDKGHYMFKRHVGSIIGKNLNEFDDLRNCEVNDFRFRMRRFANRVAQERKSRLSRGPKSKLLYQFPPRIVPCPEDRNHGFGPRIPVKLAWNDRVVDEIASEIRPGQLIAGLAQKFGFDPVDCFIKAVGEESYLITDNRMIDFEYVRNRLAQGKRPVLTVIAVDLDLDRGSSTLEMDNDEETFSLSEDLHSLTALSINNLGLDKAVVDSTSVSRPFRVYVDSLQLSEEYFNGPSSSSQRLFGLEMALYNGSKQLCPMHKHLFKGLVSEGGVVPVEQRFEFQIEIGCLPRMTKLCLGVYEEKKKDSNVHQPLFWLNSSIFDYKGRLKRSSTLHLWDYTGGNRPTHHNLSPLRTCLSNLNFNGAADIVLSFTDSEMSPFSVEFPVHPKRNSVSSDDVSEPGVVGGNNVAKLKKLYAQELNSIAERDPLHDLTVQEKDLIWQVREFCLQDVPELIPRIVDCVDFTDQSQMLELNSLLERWPNLKPEQALQLLDYAYSDENVRRFAVRCLRQASDEQILRYLLQLVQALKHESYFQCDLVEFLLERALNNQHIGHHLFWELKAEMSSPFVGLFYGLILETYLTAAPEHLRVLERQMMLLENCRAVAVAVQRAENATKSFERGQQQFEVSVRQLFMGPRPFLNFISPLNPAQRCQRLRLERCKVMLSKMRPQMFAFDNMDGRLADGLGQQVEDVVLMYKAGDDLRQDRLCLQLLLIFDTLWKNAGLDLSLSVYRCISTDSFEGFIEVVSSAETLCRIQMSQAGDGERSRSSAAAVFRKGLLLAYLKKHNKDEDSLIAAQGNFVRSCAGYLVATYVLGIGDRHNDNIMLKKNGQLLHIDFGHFLGNFKHKFGIRRERVPMVIASEFVEIIKADLQPGKNGGKSNFDQFRDLCEKAFLVIRRNGHLVISLLAMMISTGLPELSEQHDLDIIRITLQLDRGKSGEREALEHFRKAFNESLRNAWTISLDWWFHMMNQTRPRAKT